MAMKLDTACGACESVSNSNHYIIHSNSTCILNYFYYRKICKVGLPLRFLELIEVNKLEKLPRFVQFAHIIKFSTF